MKTKISLMLLGLGLVSGAAYAGAVAEPMPVSNDINVTAPDQSGMWSFGATAVLMQPNNKTFNYADVSTLNFSGVGSDYVLSDTQHQTVDEGYHWWFGADITYAFPGNGRDVTLAYEGLHGTDTDHTSGDTIGTANPNNPNLRYLNTPIVTSTFTGAPYLTAEGKTQTNYDAGDLTFGQKLDVGSRIRLHPFIGLRYAYINTKDTATYTGGDPADLGLPFAGTTMVETGELGNTFNGIGPRFGSDAQINLGQGFSVRGRLGLSALIGSRSIKYSASPLLTVYDANNTVVGTADIKNDSDSDTHVIPEIDGRLGLNYTYTFDSNMALGIEAGWQATNYFNVVGEQYTTGPLYSDQTRDYYQDSSNFGVQGPYARLQLDLA